MRCLAPGCRRSPQGRGLARDRWYASADRSRGRCRARRVRAGVLRAGDPGVHAAPSRATDLSGLPPAYLDIGSAESFRDETLDYAAGIWQAGGAAELHVWPGGYHGFELMAPDAAISVGARETRIAWLHRILAC